MTDNLDNNIDKIICTCMYEYNNIKVEYEVNIKSSLSKDLLSGENNSTSNKNT